MLPDPSLLTFKVNAMLMLMTNSTFKQPNLKIRPILFLIANAGRRVYKQKRFLFLAFMTLLVFTLEAGLAETYSKLLMSSHFTMMSE